MKYKIFIVSFLVFAVINIIENLIHFNIGKHSQDFIINFSIPSFYEWMNIISTMIIFALLQAILTSLFVLL
jgi:hypothetical protein